VTQIPDNDEDAGEDALTERYRAASAAEDSRPPAALRTAIRAQAWKQLAVPAARASAGASPRVASDRSPAANDSHWRLRAVAGLAVVAVGVAIVMQLRRSDTQAPVAAATSKTTPPAATAVPATAAAPDNAPAVATGQVAQSRAAAASPPAAARVADAKTTPPEASAAAETSNFVQQTARAGAAAASATLPVPVPVLVQFEAGAEQPDAAAASELRGIGAYLRANETAQADIASYFDSGDDSGAAAELARRRATAVQTLLESLGVPASRTELTAPASVGPAADTADAAGPTAARVGVRVSVR